MSRSNSPQSPVPDSAKGLLDIGNSCTYCSAIDFLPFQCDDCGHTFCGDHRHPHLHECTYAISKERQRLRDLAYTPGSSPSKSANSSARSSPTPAGGKTLGSGTNTPITGPQRTAIVQQQLKQQQQRTKEKEDAADKRNKGNMAALEKLRSIWGNKSSGSNGSTATAKPKYTIMPKTTAAKKELSGARAVETSSTGSKLFSKIMSGSSQTSSSGNASASKISAAALLQLKRDAKPLDPNRSTNVAVNGSPGITVSGTTPGRRYLVLVAYGSVVGPYQAESGAGIEKRESKNTTVYMASNLTVGKIVDRAVDLLRVPRTMKTEDSAEEKRAALFLNGEMLPYSQPLDKVLGGIIKDGDRLSVKYV